MTYNHKPNKLPAKVATAMCDYSDTIIKLEFLYPIDSVQTYIDFADDFCDEIDFDINKKVIDENGNEKIKREYFFVEMNGVPFDSNNKPIISGKVKEVKISLRYSFENNRLNNGFPSDGALSREHFDYFIDNYMREYLSGPFCDSYDLQLSVKKING